MVAPHELLHELFVTYPQQFQLRLGADEIKCQRFWDQFRQTPRGAEFVRNHPHLQQCNRWHRLIPLTVHIDAGPYTKNQSVTGLSMSSPLGEGSEAETVFMIATWIKQQDRNDSAECWCRMQVCSLAIKLCLKRIKQTWSDFSQISKMYVSI